MAADPHDGVSRRDALKVGALLGTASGLSGLLGALPRTSGAATPHPAEPYRLATPEMQVATTCAGCTGACPVRVSVVEGQIAKLDGNPFSPRQGGDPRPTTAEQAARLRGASCARGQARVNVVHDPWRVVRPLLRQGPRGSLSFRTASAEQWSGSVLPGIVSAHRVSRGSPPGSPPRIVVGLDPRHQDRRLALVAAMNALAGAEGILGHPAPRLAQATAALTGPGWLAAPRWERGTCLVAWGADPIASGLDPVGSARALAGRREALITIDPRLSATASMGRRWLPVRPGADGDLALWVASRWAQRGWLPRDALPAPALGRPTSDWERRVGLGHDLVDALAESMHEAGPGLAVALGNALSPDAAQAVLTLCAHVGALGPAGAMAPAFDPTPPIHGPQALHDAVCGDAAPDVVVIVGDGGLQDTPYLSDVLDVLADPARVSRVVVVATMPGPLWRVADAVLPDVTEMERWGVVQRHDGASVTLPALSALPSAVTEGPLGRGLEGLIEAITDAAGVPFGAAEAQDRALAELAAGLPAPTPAEDAILRASLADRGPAVERGLASGPGVRALLIRGWVPPSPAPPPVVRVPALGGELTEEGPDIVLVGYAEAFAGTADRGAEVWGARTVRADNKAWVHPSTAEGLAGVPTGFLKLRTGLQEGEIEARITQEVRPGVIAVARGYGQRVGYGGDLVIDGEAQPVDEPRGRGLALGSLLTGPIEVAWTDPPPPTSWFTRLMPGRLE